MIFPHLLDAFSEGNLDCSQKDSFSTFLFGDIKVFFPSSFELNVFRLQAKFEGKGHEFFGAVSGHMAPLGFMRQGAGTDFSRNVCIIDIDCDLSILS